MSLLRALNDVVIIIFSSGLFISFQSSQVPLLHLLTLTWQLLPFKITYSQRKNVDPARKNLTQRFHDMDETVPLCTPHHNPPHATAGITRRERIQSRIKMPSHQTSASIPTKESFEFKSRATVDVDEVGELLERTIEALKHALLPIVGNVKQSSQLPQSQQLSLHSEVVQLLVAIVSKCNESEVLSRLGGYLTALFDHNNPSSSSSGTNSLPTTIALSVAKSISNSKNGIERAQLWLAMSRLLSCDKIYEKFLLSEMALLRHLKANKTGNVSSALPMLLFALQELKTDSLDASTLQYHHAMILCLKYLLLHRRDTALMIILQYATFESDSSEKLEHVRDEDAMDVDDDEDNDYHSESTSSHQPRRKKGRLPQTPRESTQSLHSGKQGKRHLKTTSGSKRKSSTNSTATAAATMDEDNADENTNISMASKRNAADESTVFLPEETDPFAWRTFALADVSAFKLRHGKVFLTSFVQYWFELWRLCDHFPANAAGASVDGDRKEEEKKKSLFKVVIDVTRLLNAIVGALTKDQQRVVLRDALPWIEAFMVRYCIAGLNPAIQLTEQDVNHLDTIG